MIVVLGASGYIGQAFCRELCMRGIPFIPLSRAAFDYTHFYLLLQYLRKIRPALLINASGYCGRPNVDECEEARRETLQANTLLPQIVVRACLMTNVPWAHISTGCIYTGAKVLDKGGARVEPNLNRPRVRNLFASNPERFRGFSETDEPNFSFRNTSFNFCSGTRALAEEVLKGLGQGYIWRAMIPFDERDVPCNFLSRIQRYPKVFDHVTSLSHLGDFVRACLALWERHAPFGTYNVANPGAVTTRQVVGMIQRILKPDRWFKYWADNDEFYTHGAKALRSNCILNVTKLSCAGVHVRHVQEALEDSLRHWKPEDTNGDETGGPMASLLSCLSGIQRPDRLAGESSEQAAAAEPKEAPSRCRRRQRSTSLQAATDALAHLGRR